MAKGRYTYWLTPEGRTLLRGWARDGFTDVQIAKKIGVSRKTLSAWKVKYKDVAETLAEGKEVADYRVENALYSKCLKGNVRAAEFWLKNRQREKWRDRPDLSTEVTLEKLDEVLSRIGGSV